MTTTVGASTSYPLTIPELSETADIQTAIKLIAYGQSADPTNNADIETNSLAGYLATKASTTSPAISTSITTASSSFSLINTTATTINIGGAATTMTIGNTATGAQTVNMFTGSTGASTYNFATGNTNAGVTKTLNLGTGGGTGSTTNINLGAGTSSQSSTININGKLALQSGSLSSPAVAGKFEYTGDALYFTPKLNNSTAGRGLVSSEQIIVLDSNYTPSTLTGISNETIEVTNSAFNKSLYLAASQAYFVDMSIIVYHSMTIASGGSASATFSLSAPTSSTCHITAFSIVDKGAITGGTPNLEFFTGSISGNTELLITASGTDTGYSILKWSGIIYINTTAGNFTPQITRSVTSGASASSAQIVVQAGSYCKVTPLGTYASQINVGGWA